MVVVWIGVRNFWMFFIVFVSFWLFCVFSESYHGLYIVEYFFKTAVDAQYVPVQYFFIFGSTRLYVTENGVESLRLCL